MAHHILMLLLLSSLLLLSTCVYGHGAHSHAAGINDDKRCPSCNMAAKDAKFTWFTELNNGQRIYTCAMNTGDDYKKGSNYFSHPSLVGATMYQLANSSTTCTNACPECDDSLMVVKDPISGDIVSSKNFTFICLKRGQKIYFSSTGTKATFLAGLAASPYFGVRNVSCGGNQCPDQFQVPNDLAATTTAPSPTATSIDSSTAIADAERFCTGASVMFSGFQTTVHGTCVKLFFQPWVLDTSVKYAFGFIGVFALPLMNEYLVRTRESLRQTFRKRKNKTPSVKQMHKIILTLLYMAQMTIAYLAMLVVMIYDTGLFISLILGFGFGFILFKAEKPIATKEEPTETIAAVWRFSDFKSLTILHVPQMMCAHKCGGTITRALEQIEGVHRIYIDISDKCVYVSGSAPSKELMSTLDDIGYEASLLHEPVPDVDNLPTMQRIERIQGHMHAPAAPVEVVIVAATRTPIAKAKRGAFKDTTPDVLLRHVFEGIINQTKIDPKIIGDIVVGNVLQPGSAAVGARMGQLCAGIPYSVPLNSVNRQCSSGLQAFANVAAGIRAGYYDVGIAAGVESMSLTDMASSAPEVAWEDVYANEAAKNCTVSMGLTSENVAAKYGITRTQQDTMAAESHAKAAAAQQNGLFKGEITPVILKTDDGKEVVVSQDEGIRPGTSVQGLAKLRASFKENGTTTAGNSSQVSDGAAACLVMTRAMAEKLQLPILGSFVSYSVVGVPPEIMGVGPALAIPDALAKAGLTINDIDIFEINEAFASQALFCIDHLKIPKEKVNPKGGAIALGHPLGCTGARQIATLLYELKRTNKQYGVVSMCIGTGMGAAAIFKRERMVKKLDLYSILDVPPHASMDEVKQAYRKLALLHHPDRKQGSVPAEGVSSTFFQDVNEAYDTLSNPESRTAYDLKAYGMSTFATSTNPIEGAVKDDGYKRMTSEDVNRLMAHSNSFDRFSTAEYHRNRSVMAPNAIGRRTTGFAERKQFRAKAVPLPSKNSTIGALIVPVAAIAIMALGVNIMSQGTRGPKKATH
ncbi:3-ketoacyl-CoA thiolase A [Thraustotheca clavata]|uniref:acetyl-CoA C-acyltransferase n=1 Tax=Thraustotheca clavata TaxID=74557 RepID=A0A1V9ZD67_9STRA|nr:3-ketoacyl-CoA thiolase A [Thraustotheca clavata]